MERLVILAIIGFLAQLVDGSLGMAYGLTSTSLLLLFGIAPSIASASVHLSEVVTTAASGISHWKFGNIDRGVLWRLIVPGSIGAFIGACSLSALPGDVVKPFVSGFLLLLGIYLLIRFVSYQPRIKDPSNETQSQKRWVDTPLGLSAGFLDAIGGGGWGPLATPILLSRDDLEPRKVIGTVDASEFAVAVSASLGFLLTLGWQKIDWTWVLILMAGGVLAAPLAAWIVQKVRAEFLGVTVGGMIVFTNSKILLSIFHTPLFLYWIIYLIIGLCWIVEIVLAWQKARQRSEASDDNSAK
jgi:uncharacterized membrane protein YfcA